MKKIKIYERKNLFLLLLAFVLLMGALADRFDISSYIATPVIVILAMLINGLIGSYVEKYSKKDDFKRNLNKKK